MNRPHRAAFLRSAAWLSLAILLALAAAGCAGITLPSASDAPAEAPAVQSTPDLAAQAEGFWTKNDSARSELLYSRLLDREDLDREARMQALDRLAESAFLCRHYHLAKQTLDRRAGADNSVLATWPWHDLYLRTLTALDRPDLLMNHQAWLSAHTELPFQVRSRAAVALSEIYGRRGEALRAIEVLAGFHRSAPGRADKSAMESEYAARLRELSLDQLLGLTRVVGTSGRGLFPHELIQREAARRGQSLRSALPLPGVASLPILAQGSPMDEPALLAQAGGRTRSDQPAALLPGTGSAPVRLALVLPLSGRFAATGQKVLRGAGAAQALLGARGQNIEVIAVNSEAPDWKDQLKALPAGCVLVGGPLRPETLREMEASGVMASRAVFAFLPSLAGLQEGRQAWRLFSSPADQAHALVGLAADALGIRSVAVLAPKSAYGQRMAEVFQAEAKAKGLRLAASESYPPEDHPRWIKSVSRLLRIPEGFRQNKNMPLPMPDFGAVFLPEDWTQSELLASNFHFYEGQHLLFLGPDLWSVGMDNAREVDDTYFQNAACPGAWWPETAGARALQAELNRQALGQADFWVALGYDFVQLAARLALPQEWSPALVNARLAALKGLEPAMAPVNWDADGRARQALYLFSPRKDGKALVDVDELRQSVQKARERRERRLAHSRELQKARKLEPASGSLTKDVP